MYRATHTRNIVVAIAVICGILLIAGPYPFPAVKNDALAAGPHMPLQQAGFSFRQASYALTVTAGGSNILSPVTLDNDSGIDATFAVTTTGQPAGWTVEVAPPSQFIPDAGSGNFAVRIVVPANTAPGQYSLTLRATSPQVTGTATAFLTVTVVAATPTPGTPTATTGPTPTPSPVCVGNAEPNDPGNDRGSAQLILVDVVERHGICRIGDQDWFKFGAIGGKVYTIDVPEMDAGLDLSLDLYDDQGNRLTSNDDFFARNPPTPTPARDIRPRIQSWRAPRDGLYFFLVRDTLNLGGGGRGYTIVVNSESYGPTPITIPEICRDLFEEDGLPEQATLMTSNELQPAHILCPTGDADWIRFFGSVGKTYYLYTDTRPYANQPDLNGETEAGADTVLYLADRDGVSIIDFNDDIASGTPSLDSEIRFTPTVDGFYYAQVKNVGDIGNQFIRYNLVLKLCIPGQECGRSPVTQASPTSAAPTPTEVLFATRTPTPTPTETEEGTFSQSTLKPGPMVNGPLHGFADRAFEQVWQRNDRPVAEQRAARSWAWGPRGLMARAEGYLQSASGLRQVQYFDKARMEVNNPSGNRNSRWFVTTGLLVVELVSGKAQIGNNEFVRREPAAIPIAGDPDDSNGPTYASFAGVTGLAPGDRTGQLAGETINRAGQVGSYGGVSRAETRMAHFVAETGHNIPQVFWDYLNARGGVYEGGRFREGTLVDWVFTLGYPISEPYWTRIRVGGVERDVLVQAFQRRVLTYTPDNPGGWQVEMGNVGRHYYFWRYGENLPS